MDGNLPRIEENRRLDVIEKWMEDCVRNGGIGRQDELHIDRIDSAWLASHSWIAGSLESLRLAACIKQKRSEYRNVSVAAALSLQSATQKRGVDFRTSKELEKQLGSVPPSLYLFHSGEEPWTETKKNVTIQKVKRAAFYPFVMLNDPYYMEFSQHGEDEYCRSIFFTE